MAGAEHKPWDARLACRLVYPLRNTFITPNHLTALRLACGLLAFYFFCVGGYLHTNIGALLFVISNFLDHTDGELARLTGNSSAFGHYFDLYSDALVNISLFVGLGIGLMQGGAGGHAGLLGGISGLAVAAIFIFIHGLSELEKKSASAGDADVEKLFLEAEDILYLVPIVTLLQLDYYFLLLAGAGAPLFCVWVARQYFLRKRQSGACPSRARQNDGEGQA